ncbi:hypothetical protein [uncultured Cyclobacterium sp.]|uniref:hypothetical protein n=1 Tax=uncultured Cyclobacterium sp. TaxID=453820 RepID=UPI0030EDC6C6|tara:strand:+ start:46371 stop:46622 length:252 start_codon:yes stop_codon:yes gene_type:complete
MNTYIFIYAILGATLGLLFTIKAIRNAEDDPETFDKFKNEGRFHKPANWRIGKMPKNNNNQKEDTLQFQLAQPKAVYHEMHLN